MAWYWWVLLWAVLVLGAAGVLAVLGLSLWRRAKVLLREVGSASDRLGAVADRIQKLQDQDGVAEPPAVFSTGSQLRQDRFLTARRTGVPERQRRSVR